MVIYSNYFYNCFHEKNLFSNPDNVFIKQIAQQDNTIINRQRVNVKINLVSNKLAKKEAKKATTTAKKVELAVAKKANTIVAKLKKEKVAEKLAIEKKV